MYQLSYDFGILNEFKRIRDIHKNTFHSTLFPEVLLLFYYLRKTCGVYFVHTGDFNIDFF